MSNNIKSYIYTFPTYSDANSVMTAMYDIAKRYGWAAVSDLNDLCGLNDTFDDTTKGWSLDALDNAMIEECADSYKLVMPPYNRFKEALDEYDCNCCACEECDEYDEYDYGREPVNLSIPFECYLEHPEVIDHAIQALFKVPEKLEGRPIFISIT